MDAFLRFLAWANDPTKISTGFAGLVASVMVAIGWVINARNEQRASRIDRAHEALLVKNKKFMANLQVIKPRLLPPSIFPTHTEFAASETGRAELKALHEIFNELETLALDISTGRGSEIYTRETQRSLICDIMVSSQDHIEHLRVSRGHSRLLKNLEILFIRLYFNRYPVAETFIEVIIGRPQFWFSYLNFRMRYLLACVPFGAPWDYRKQSYPEIRIQLRRLRHGLVFGWGLLAVVLLLTSLPNLF
jgi:hypothetical protein